MIQPVHVSKQIKQISNIDSNACCLLDLVLGAKQFAATTFCRNSQLYINSKCYQNKFKDEKLYFLQLTKM